MEMLFLFFDEMSFSELMNENSGIWKSVGWDPFGCSIDLLNIVIGVAFVSLFFGYGVD